MFFCRLFSGLSDLFRSCRGCSSFRGLLLLFGSSRSNYRLCCRCFRRSSCDLDLLCCRNGFLHLPGLPYGLFRLVEVHFHLCGLHARADDLVRHRLRFSSGPSCSLISAGAGLSGRSGLSSASGSIGTCSSTGVRSARIGAPLSGTLTALTAVSRHDNDLFLFYRSLAVNRSGLSGRLPCFFVLICTCILCRHLLLFLPAAKQLINTVRKPLVRYGDA